MIRVNNIVYKAPNVSAHGAVINTIPGESSTLELSLFDITWVIFVSNQLFLEYKPFTRR